MSRVYSGGDWYTDAAGGSGHLTWNVQDLHHGRGIVTTLSLLVNKRVTIYFGIIQCFTEKKHSKTVEFSSGIFSFFFFSGRTHFVNWELYCFVLLIISLIVLQCVCLISFSFLFNVPWLAQVYSIRTRSRSVEIFTTCANLICAIEELEKVRQQDNIMILT